jgi:hypothetical protein
MLEKNNNTNQDILNDDELDALITEKFQRLQEQLEVRKQVDSRTSNMLHYYLEM